METLMINVLFLFPKSTDLKALDDFISNKFIPGIKQAHGLRSLKLSAGDLMGAGGPPPYSRVVEASFDSLDAFMATVPPDGEPEKETMRSLGTLILFYEVSEL
jgi:hypothetical protein